MVTALDSMENVDAAVRAGAQDYLVKPFTRSALASAVENQLTAPGSLGPGALRYSSLQRACA